MPPLNATVRRFSDRAAIDSYVRDSAYLTPSLGGGAGIFAAIVVNSPRPGLDYSIRMNSSEVPSTSDDPVSTVALGEWGTGVGGAPCLAPSTAPLAPVAVQRRTRPT